MSNEDYPCYVRISEESSPNECVELPTEKDGSMLLTTVKSQFPDAIGLRFKTESGAWRGVRLSNDGKEVLDPPPEGWGYNEYVVTLPKAGSKRKEDSTADAPRRKKGKKEMTEKEMLSDLIVLGLSYEATEEDLKTFFEKYGELDMYEIKFDPATKKSRGFGFVRYKTVAAVEAVLAATPVTMMERKLNIRFPKKKDGNDGGPTKIFVGRLAGGTTADDLREYFSKYGEIAEVYVPPQFRGYGFVTMESSEDAHDVVSAQHHVIKGQYANVSYPTRGKQAEQQAAQQQQQQQNMGMPPQNYAYGMNPNMNSPSTPGYGNQGPPGQGGYGNPGTGYSVSGYGNQGGNQAGVGGYGNQGGGGYSNQGGSGYSNQGGGGYSNQGGGGSGNQGAGGFGNQAGGGFGNNMKNQSGGYGYFQPGGKTV